jgi:hypothetical protein
MVADSHHIYRHFRGQTLVSHAFPNWNNLLCGSIEGGESSRAQRQTSASILSLLTRQMKHHECVFVVFTPGPGFRDVVRIVELDNQVMLMSRGG